MVMDYANIVLFIIKDAPIAQWILVVHYFHVINVNLHTSYNSTIHYVTVVVHSYLIASTAPLPHLAKHAKMDTHSIILQIACYVPKSILIVNHVTIYNVYHVLQIWDYQKIINNVNVF